MPLARAAIAALEHTESTEMRENLNRRKQRKQRGAGEATHSFRSEATSPCGLRSSRTKPKVALLMRDTKKGDISVFFLDSATLALREVKRHVSHIALSFLCAFVASCEVPFSVSSVRSVRDVFVV